MGLGLCGVEVNLRRSRGVIEVLGLVFLCLEF